MRLFAVAALAALLTACGASAPPPVHTPPKPAIVALAGTPPAAVTPKPATVTLDHTNWAITVPGSWTVKEDGDDGCQVVRERDDVNHVLPAMVEVSVNHDVDSAEAWAMGASAMVEQAAGQMGTVSGVHRALIEFHGVTGSLTQVNLAKEGVFIGQLAIQQEATKIGYAVICVAPANPDDAKLMATITKTFVMKDVAPEIGRAS